MPATTFADVLKFNPYHDSKGRFASADAATSFTYAPGKSTAHDKAIQRAKDADAAEAGKGFKGRLYHGSPVTDIEEFDMSRAGANTSSGEKLLFFTDSKQLAEDFSYERLEGSTKYFQRRGEKGRVYEVDVEIKNPLDFRNLSDKDIDNILKLDIEGILTREEVKSLSGNHQLLKTNLDLRAESLKKLGYDGLIANTGKAGHYALEYAVVDSKQATIRKGVIMKAMTFEEILKFNPYHDAKGRFTTASSGGGVVPTIKRESVLSAIRELPACNDVGEPIEHSGELPSELCVNPVPYAGDEVSDEIYDLIVDRQADGIDPWDNEHSALQSVKVSSIKSNQTALDRINMVMLMNEGLSDIEFDEEICIVKHKGQYILQDGNHRTALAKLSGRTSVTARVYDADKQRVKKSEEEIEKFNPYHDERGRFTTADAATLFTIRTKDPDKQFLANEGIRQEQARHEADLNGPRMKTVHAIEDKIRNQDFESAACVDKDGKVIFFKNGIKDRVGFSKEEQELCKDRTLTHNHPSSSMFSPEDVDFWVDHDLQEIRATNREGITYSLSRGKDYTKFQGESFSFLYKMSRMNAQMDATQELDDRGFRGKLARGEITQEEANAELRKAMAKHLSDFWKDRASDFNVEFRIDKRKVTKSAGAEYTAKSSDGENVIYLDHEEEAWYEAAFNAWLTGVPMEEQVVVKFNPYHDQRGRFSTADGATVFTYAPGKSKAHDNAIAREKERDAAGSGSAYEKELEEEQARVLAMKPNEQAEYVWDHDGETEDNCVAAMKNGETEALVKNYFAIMKANGDPTPTNPTSGQVKNQLKDEVEYRRKYKGYEEARTDYIQKMTGMDEAEAAATLKEFNKWFSGSWGDADTATLDNYISKDHVYDGKMYRGMKFNPETFDAFMENISPGATISMRRNSSWSSDEAVARSFAAHSYDATFSVMVTCVKNRTSAPVDHLSGVAESEVIAHSNAKWTVLHSEVVTWPSGAKKAYLTVVEKGE